MYLFIKYGVIFLYHTGVFGILWYVAWYILAFESPSVHPTISKDEKAYIELSAINMEEVRIQG